MTTVYITPCIYYISNHFLSAFSLAAFAHLWWSHCLHAVHSIHHVAGLSFLIIQFSLGHLLTLTPHPFVFLGVGLITAVEDGFLATSAAVLLGIKFHLR